jgi:hypothetical protein
VRSRGQNSAPVLNFEDQIVKLNFQSWMCLNYSKILNYIDKYMVKNCDQRILGGYKCDKRVADIIKVQKVDIYAMKLFTND